MSRYAMFSARKTIVALLVVPALFLAINMAAGPQAAAVEINMGTYAAIAYSTSTGAYGYSWNSMTKEGAESAALEHCHAADAKIVGWVQGGWLVLVSGSNNAYGVGWEYGNGAGLNKATRRALNECAKRSEKIHRVIRLCSGNYQPEVLEFEPSIDPAKIHTGD